MQEIQIKCKGTNELLLSEMSPLQGNLKKLTKENAEKLKNSILTQGFTAPFFIWEDKDKNYILDGHQRFTVLSELSSKYVVPRLPVCKIIADNIKDAKKKLLSITSHFGDITKDGLVDFLAEFEEMDFSELQETINFDFELPELFPDNFPEDMQNTMDIIPDVDIQGEVENKSDYIIIRFESDEEAQEARKVLEMPNASRIITLQKLKEAYGV